MKFSTLWLFLIWIAITIGSCDIKIAIDQNTQAILRTRQ